MNVDKGIITITIKKKKAQNTAFKNVIICKFPYILLHENNVKC